MPGVLRSKERTLDIATSHLPLPGAGNPDTKLVVLATGADYRCYGTTVLPVSALGDIYTIVCAGYREGDTCKVRLLHRAGARVR